MSREPTIGVVFITHCARQHLKHCLPPITSSILKPKVLLVNSESLDGTVEEAARFGVNTLTIPRKSFNHGATRELARKELDTDIVVMMTPDAYALDNMLLDKLIAPLRDTNTAISYARQIPHDGASFLEAFPRHFNYPEKSETRCFSDVKKYGVYTFFCSDTCAAYKNKVLDEIGGFPTVLTAEDSFAVYEILKKGYNIAYAAEALVKHSHKYSLQQEFQRHYDTGYMRSLQKELIKAGGGDSRRGREFLWALSKALIKEKPSLLPYAALQTLSKWLGYKLGYYSHKAPKILKKTCSGQEYYWDSDIQMAE